jgi:hypothetical protein
MRASKETTRPITTMEPIATKTVGDRVVVVDEVVGGKNWRGARDAALTLLDIGSACVTLARHSRRLITGKIGDNSVDI